MDSTLPCYIGIETNLKNKQKIPQSQKQENFDIPNT